ncbi:MAG TPA: TolC family protein [Polyangia bacterium]|nr:TolC family protein [Polyangia bacterium]
MRPNAWLLVALSLVPAAAAARTGGPDVTLASRLTQLVARPGGLGADDVAALTVGSSFTLRQRRLEAMAAAAGVDQALVAYFPRLTLAARYARLSPIDNAPLGNVVVAPASPLGLLPPGAPLANASIAFTSLLNQTSLQATLVVPLSEYVWRIPAAHAAATSNREAARATERAARLQLAADARVGYYQWARARLQVVVAEQALAQAQTHLDAARRLFEAGSASKADVLRVEAQVAASELFATRARNLEAVLEDQLRTAMHDATGRRYEIGEDLQAELAPLAVPPAPALVDEAWARRLELRVLGHAERAARAQATVARSGILPQLALFGDVLAADPNPRFFPQKDSFETTWDAGVQLSWTPNDTASSLFAGRAGDDKAQAAAAQIGALRDALRNEVMQTYEALREADFAVGSTARGLDAAEESYRVRRELFANGRATSIELTDAETDLTQARLAAVGARIDQRIARVRLLHAAGRDTN